VVLHRHVLALDVAGFVEALTERTNNAHRDLGRPAVDEADGRHHRLLRVHPDRPRSRRAAEQRDELAAFQLIEWHSVPCQREPGCKISNSG
jgi:hypothetical protein